MKKAIFIIIAILILGGIGTSLGIYLYIKSPVYTFKQIRKSVKNHDWELFNKYVDVGSLYTSQISESNMNSFASGLEAMSRENLKTTFIDNLKSIIEGNTGSPENEILILNLLPPKLSWDSYENTYQLSRMKKSKGGKLLNIDIPLKTWFNFYLDVSFRFRNEALKYKLIGYDSDNYENTNEELVCLMSDFYNLPIREKLKNAVSFSIAKNIKNKEDGFFYVIYQATNNGHKDITDLVYYLYPNKEYLEQDKYGIYESVGDFKIKQNESLKLITHRNRKYVKYDSEDQEKAFMNADLNNLAIKIEKIIFSDGGILEEKSKYENVNRFEKEYPEATYNTFLNILNIREKYGLHDAEALKAKHETYRK